MKTLRVLLVVEAAGLSALLAIASAMAAYGAIDSLLAPGALFTPADSARTYFIYTAAFGLLPVAVIGAPGYVALLHHGLARWPCVLALGSLPGLVALPFAPGLGLWAIVCGLSVAGITHLACRRLG